MSPFARPTVPKGYTKAEIDAALTEYPAWWLYVSYIPTGFWDGVRSISLGRRGCEDICRHIQTGCGADEGQTSSCRVPMCGESVAATEDRGGRDKVEMPGRLTLAWGRLIVSITPLIEKLLGKMV